jgi:hypothetical protein
MYICELEFRSRDPDNPNIYMMEVDYYASIPYTHVNNPSPQHALSLRKTWGWDIYEVYRRVANPPNKPEEVVIFRHHSLQKAIDYASMEWMKFWGFRERDKCCEHIPGKSSVACPKVYGRVSKR